MSETPILKIDHVHKMIGRRAILSDISFSVNKGEILGLLGPNGSGKTTLIRSVLGLVALSDGEVSVGGFSIKNDFEEAIAMVGAIVENPEFYDYMTGYQNLVHFANMSHSVETGRIEEVIELVGLGGRIHEKVRTYSLGMRQRLGIAQAVLHRPRLLLLDEPTNGLDPSGIIELRKYLLKLRDEEGVSIVISTHLLKEIEDVCDRIAIIQAGKILSVQEVGGQDKSSPLKVFLEVDDTEKAIITTKAYQSRAVRGGVEITALRKDIPHINRQLVDNGIEIFAIRPKYKDLEESFLEITEGGSR